MVCARVATVIPKHNAILTVFAAASPRQLPHPTKTNSNVPINSAMRDRNKLPTNMHFQFSFHCHFYDRKYFYTSGFCLL